MSNLKEETLKILAHHNKSIADIKWIGRSDGAIKIPIDYFFEIANKEYNAGYGSNEVNMDLVIVGNDWWLERYEYDGSEHWEFKSVPILQSNNRFGKSIFVEDFDNAWAELSNLEYLEWEEARKTEALLNDPKK